MTCDPSPTPNERLASRLFREYVNAHDRLGLDPGANPVVRGDLDAQEWSVRTVWLDLAREANFRVKEEIRRQENLVRQRLQDGEITPTEARAILGTSVGFRP